MQNIAPCGCPIVQVTNEETRVVHTMSCNDPNIIEREARRERHERYVQSDRDETEG